MPDSKAHMTKGISGTLEDATFKISLIRSFLKVLSVLLYHFVFIMYTRQVNLNTRIEAIEDKRLAQGPYTETIAW